MSSTVVSRARAEAPVERLTVAAYTVPTDAPEADGTFAFRSALAEIGRAPFLATPTCY
jgi:hypothetical protein